MEAEDREAAIDARVLREQTLGDEALEAELFALFASQAARLWPVISGPGEPTARREAAHMLKGSAAAIGATAVMRICGELEAAFARPGAEPGCEEGIAALGAALDAAAAAVEARRRA